MGYLRIRDHILIDAALKTKLEAQPASITLVARAIEHAPGIDLNLPGREIIIVADRYDAKGHTINVSGPDAGAVPDGVTGAAGLATANFNRPGGPGTNGSSGANAANAGSIRIIAQRLGDVRLLARGGAGGKGGDDGSGGGGTGRADNPHSMGSRLEGRRRRRSGQWRRRRQGWPGRCRVHGRGRSTRERC